VRYSRLVVLLSMAVLGLASVASAQQAGEPIFEAVWIPLTETPSPGSPREVKLEGMLYRPPAPGMLPGAVTVWETAVQSFLAKVGLDQPRN
jgi:hypothetical protein